MPQPGAPETTDSKGFVERRTVQNRDTGEEFTTIQKFARALQGLGAGLQGQTAPFFQQDVERERLKFAKETQDIQRRVSEAQIGRAEAENAIDATKIMGEVGKMASLESDPEKRKKLYSVFSPVISGMMTRGRQNGGEWNLSSAEGVSSLLETIATSGLDPETMLTAYPLMMNPNERKAYASLLKQDLPKAEEFAKSRSEARLNELNSKFATEMRNLSPAALAANKIHTIDDAVDLFVSKLPQAQGAAYKIALQRTDPKVLDQLATQIGVMGPSQVGKAKSIQIEAAAELLTQQGQQKSELAAAQIADLQTPKVIAQAAPETGIFVQAKGKEGGLKEVKPALKAEKTLGPEAARMVTGLEAQVQALNRIDTLLASGTADKFLGPLFTGARFKEWAVKNLPQEWVGMVPDELALLDMAEFTVKNIHVQARTGAAVRETEEPRLFAEVPDRFRDKPEVYRTKLREAVANSNVLLKRMRLLFGPEGTKYLIDPKLGAVPGNVSPLLYTQHPLKLKRIPVSEEPVK